VAGARYVVPHHHCNVDRVPAAGDAVLFVGGVHWRPELGVPFEIVDTTAIALPALRAAYARAHVLVNLRVDSPAAAAHARLASGIKLINAIGFGVPSVSAREPAYDEIGPDCTLFATPATAADAIRTLQRDPALHAELRRRCLARADAYHLDAICARYREVLADVLA
jgi:glycosyltransferase involved in cell wall biosynthesis